MVAPGFRYWNNIYLNNLIPFEMDLYYGRDYVGQHDLKFKDMNLLPKSWN